MTAWKVSFYSRLAPGFPAIELPVDFDSCAIHSAVPGTRFPAQRLQVRDSSGAEALTRQDADFDFGLVQPASVSWRVVNGETVPDFAADVVPEQVCQGFGAMNVEVVQDQVDGGGCRVLESKLEGHFGELECGTIRRGEGEVAAGNRLIAERMLETVRRSGAENRSQHAEEAADDDRRGPGFPAASP